jgi:hypothetical protein
LKYLRDEECIGETVRKAIWLAHSLLEVDEFLFNKHLFCEGEDEGDRTDTHEKRVQKVKLCVRVGPKL